MAFMTFPIVFTLESPKLNSSLASVLKVTNAIRVPSALRMVFILISKDFTCYFTQMPDFASRRHGESEDVHELEQTNWLTGNVIHNLSHP